jgi:3-oxoacyl-[acyl-carrier-protein] synthase-1
MNMSFEMTGGICVVGVGAATSIGMTAPATAAAVRAGIANFSDHPDMIDQIGEPYVVARAPYIDSDVAGEDRFVELAKRAACEALEPLGEKLAMRVQVPTVVGLPESRPGLPERLAATLAAKLTEASANGCHITHPNTLTNGHSAGLIAVELAGRLVGSGQAEFCLAGGVDSYLDRDSLKWVEDCEQLHKLDNAWGFIPGEAAGFCLLCSHATATRYELNVLGHLLGVAIAHEENRIKTETVCIGKGLTRAVRDVLQSLASSEARIYHTICDMNGEAYRADEFGFMLARTSERFVDASAFTTPADCWGDVGAASGPLFVLLACAAATKGYASGPVTLLSTSSEGGARAAALFLANIEAA